MTPMLISSDNLSVAWARAFKHIVDHPGKEISPLVFSVSGFDGRGRAAEDMSVRDALDAVLVSEEKINIADVAYTIFPQKLWEMAHGDRQQFYKMYGWAARGYRAANKRLNGRGLYFERLVEFGSGPMGGNQLEWILSQYEKKSDVRRSMFQASIFDPARDHVAVPRLGFPCMQHISFLPSAKGLTLNAFYATQQLLYRAYGNLVGLSQLGAFMAHEMGQPFYQLNIMAGVEKLDEIPKTSEKLALLDEAARACVAADDERLAEPRSRALATA